MICALQEAVLCVPTDRRLPKLRVRSSHMGRLIGQRFVVRCTGWERSSMYPSAHVLRVLGPLNDLRFGSTTSLDCKALIVKQERNSQMHWLKQIDLYPSAHLVCHGLPRHGKPVPYHWLVRWLRQSITALF